MVQNVVLSVSDNWAAKIVLGSSGSAQYGYLYDTK